MAKRKIIDWEAIEKEYRSGALSIAEIARQHDITHPAILKRAKRFGWSRDLSTEVRKRIRQKLVTDSVTSNNIDETEVTEAAAERGAEIIRLHRRDISSLRELEEQLIKELKDGPTKLYLAQYQGQIIEKIVGLTAAERAMAANNLANVQHKRIQLERQAFSLDEPDDGSGERTIRVIYDDKIGMGEDVQGKEA